MFLSKLHVRFLLFGARTEVCKPALPANNSAYHTGTGVIHWELFREPVSGVGNIYEVHAVRTWVRYLRMPFLGTLVLCLTKTRPALVVRKIAFMQVKGGLHLYKVQVSHSICQFGACSVSLARLERLELDCYTTLQRIC